MPLVMLRRNWPAAGFHRTLRIEETKGKRKGEIRTEFLQFQRGEPLEVTDEQFAALRDDIGKALQEVLVEGGKVRDKAAPEESAPQDTPAETAAEPETADA